MKDHPYILDVLFTGCIWVPLLCWYRSWYLMSETHEMSDLLKSRIQSFHLWCTGINQLEAQRKYFTFILKWRARVSDKTGTRHYLSRVARLLLGKMHMNALVITTRKLGYNLMDNDLSHMLAAISDFLLRSLGTRERAKTFLRSIRHVNAAAIREML